MSAAHLEKHQIIRGALQSELLNVGSRTTDSRMGAQPVAAGPLWGSLSRDGTLTLPDSST